MGKCDGILKEVLHGSPTLIETSPQDTIILGPTSPVNLAAHSQLLGSKEVLGRAIHQYNTDRSGLLTNPGQDYFAFEKHPEGLLSESTAADIDKAFPADWPTFSYIALDDSFVPQWNGKAYFSMSAVPLTPFSRGVVTINSTSARDHPIVDPRWLTDPRDKELVVAAFRRCRQFVATEPLSQVITGPEILPGPDYQTDEEILKYIAETSDAFYAGVGTCAMGRKDDPASVLDSAARVIGVQGLRVVDASAFPFSIDGQPMATVCMYRRLCGLLAHPVISLEPLLTCTHRCSRGENCSRDPHGSCAGLAVQDDVFFRH